jgi:hypothetical protein
MPPLYLHPVVEARFNPRSLHAYRRAVRLWLAWLDTRQLCPRSAEEFDDLLVEYSLQPGATKNSFSTLVAAVALVLPGLKGELRWAKSISASWTVVCKPKHTRPLSWIGGLLLASDLIQLGKQRESFGVLLALRTGLRPSELLNLTFGDVTFTHKGEALLALGVAHGTKVGRRQYALLKVPFLVSILRRWFNSASKSCRIVGCSYDSFRQAFHAAAKRRQWDAVYTPHSCRAGFVSESIIAGVPLPVIQAEGRWRSDSSFRSYVDAITVAGDTLEFEPYLEEARYVVDNLEALLDGTFFQNCDAKRAQENYADSGEDESGREFGATSGGAQSHRS